VATLYSEPDESTETGILRQVDEEGLKVCRLQGTWARVWWNWAHHWMKASEVAIAHEHRRFLEMVLPANGRQATRIIYCREAIVIDREGVLFLDKNGFTVGTMELPLGSPVLVCTESNGWAEVQQEQQSGWMEVAHLRISRTERPRDVGFTQKKVCKSLVWMARTREETPLRRWEGSEIVDVARVPADAPVTAAEQVEDWTWVNHGGNWGFVRNDALVIEPEVTIVEAWNMAVAQCLEEFRLVVDPAAPRYLLEQPGIESGRRVATVPRGADFIIWPGTSREATTDTETVVWRKAYYLGRTGWVASRGLIEKGEVQPMWSLFQPEPIDPELFAGLRVTAAERLDERSWSVRIGSGVAYGPGIDAMGLGVDLSARIWLPMGFGVPVGTYVFSSKDPLTAGPEAGVEWAGLVPETGLRARVGVGLGAAWLGGGREGALVVWKVDTALGAAISNRVSMDVGYVLRGLHGVYCARGDCPPDRGALLHTFGLTFEVMP
jgi:hypothetical protein